MINRILLHYLNVDASHEQYRHLTILLASILTVTVCMIGFLGFNINTGRYPILIVAESAGVILCFASLYTLLIKKQIKLASFMFLFMVTGICFLVMMFVGNRSYSLALSVIAPIFSVFLLGFRLGSLFSLLYLIAFSWLCISHIGVWKEAAFNTISFIQMTMIYVIVFILACFYEFSRIASHRLLRESNKKLAELASTDALTGLRNRRYLEDILLNESEHRFFAMVDVDDFKKVNDQYGHDEGDAVLKTIAEIMSDSIGSSGVVARWGGEEFALLFSGSLEENSEDKIRALQSCIENHDFKLSRKITVSVGAGIFHPDNHKSSLLMIDNALYEAKSSGKNCLKVFYD